jgi:formate-nitrite transporter family protein
VDTRDAGHVRQELVSYRAIFDTEVEQAVTELRRPWAALLASGVVAGASVGVSLLLLGLVVSAGGGIPDTLSTRALFGAAYASGYILAILARTDLFTEYTTIAILPVLTGDSRPRQLARLWGLVYAGNMAGGLAMAFLAATLGPALGLYEAGTLETLAEHLSNHSWSTVLLSSILAGWMMGLLSWLIAGGRDTTSQILFVGVIGMAIGALGLHHSITGSIAMFAAAIASSLVGAPAVLHVIFWASLGNAIGGIAFAVVIRQGVRIHHSASDERDRDGEAGRAQRQRGGA